MVAASTGVGSGEDVLVPLVAGYDLPSLMLKQAVFSSIDEWSFVDDVTAAVDDAVPVEVLLEVTVVLAFSDFVLKLVRLAFLAPGLAVADDGLLDDGVGA